MSAAPFLAADRTPPRTVIALLLFVMLALLPLAGYMMWSGYRQAIHNAEARTRDYAAILEARLDATLRRADADLWDLARTIPLAALSKQAEPAYARALNASLDYRLLNFEEIAGIRIADVYGDTLYTSDSAGTPRVNVADRGYFRMVRDNPEAGLVFSEVVTSRSTNQPVVIIARALRGERGTFVGAAYALLALRHFQALFQSLAIGRDDVISLRRSDDQSLVLRWPELAGEVNKPLSPQNPISERMAAGDKTATLQFTAQSDGVVRIFSYHALEHYPFYLNASFSRDDVLADWRAQWLATGTSSLLLLVGMAWLLLRLRRSLVREAQATGALQSLNLELESKVTARTAELERANQALAAKEEEIRSVVHYMADCIITIDDHGIIHSANPVVEKIFGHAPGEVIGKNVSMLMPEPDRAAHDGYLEDYRRTGQARIIGTGREVEGVHKNGERIALDLAVSEYFVHGQRFFTGILRDIRDRVHVMKDLEQARLDAEQASRAKSAFLAVMSHEIRTPMNGVIGMVDVLHQTSLKGYQVEIVDTIRDSAYSLLGIIEDILDLSKIEAGRLEIERAPTAVAGVMEQVCKMLDHLAARQDVELTLFADPAIPEEVIGDAMRLRQVVVNLVSNAIKFSSGGQRPGKVSVRAHLLETSPERVTVELQVADNGIGMDEQTQARLFMSFAQADVSTTRRFGGTGLGLAISSNLVNLMGGEITVQSAPDQGSRFTVQLPFVLVPAMPAADKEAAMVAGLSCVAVGGAEGLADDFAAYLGHGGATVERVPDLAAARERSAAGQTGLAVWVIDAGDRPLTADELRRAVPSRPDLDVRFVVIGRGGRRRPHAAASDLVLIDGNVLDRKTLLEAVAIAAGRVPPETETYAPSGVAEPGVRPPSRDEARRLGRLILVAEDNETNQKVIGRQLDLLGFAADIAGNGRDALERWRSGDYALLLTDLHMPQMDGNELAAAIRAEENDLRHTPIIALTANALAGEAERCRAAGMDDYLSKPVSLERLTAILNKWLPAATSLPGLAGPRALRHAASPPVDVGVLKSLVGDDPAIVAEFLHDFRASADTITAELRTAHLRGQASAVGAAAHKLKSSARSVGAIQLGDLCAEIERAGRASDGGALAVLIPRFEEELVAVEGCLDSLL